MSLVHKITGVVNVLSTPHDATFMHITHVFAFLVRGHIGLHIKFLRIHYIPIDFITHRTKIQTHDLRNENRESVTSIALVKD